jgi:hypothetical protein
LHEIAKCTVPRWSSALGSALAEPIVAAAAATIARTRIFMTSSHLFVERLLEIR